LCGQAILKEKVRRMKEQKEAEIRAQRSSSGVDVEILSIRMKECAAKEDFAGALGQKNARIRVSHCDLILPDPIGAADYKNRIEEIKNKEIRDREEREAAERKRIAEEQAKRRRKEKEDEFRRYSAR
jgi:hypothetical protein